MRSDEFRAAMRQQLRLFALRVLFIVCIGVAVVLAALSTSCTRTFVPSGRPGLRQDFGNDPTAAALGDMGIANDMDLHRQRMWHHMMANDQRQQLDQQAYNAHVYQRLDP